MNKALFLFNSSPYAVEPWLSSGRWQCYSVDYGGTDHDGPTRAPWQHPLHTHLSIDLSAPDALQAVTEHVGVPDIVISFPPCTDLAVSGAKHFARKLAENPDCQRDAVRMAMLAEQFGCPYMVENPVSLLSTLWRKPDLYWHPCDFGGYCPEGPHPEFPAIIPERDAYYKKTGLWAGNGLTLPTPRPVTVVAGENPGWAKLGGKSARTKYIRSLTPRGFARALYEANK